MRTQPRLNYTAHVSTPVNKFRTALGMEYVDQVCKFIYILFYNLYFEAKIRKNTNIHLVQIKNSKVQQGPESRRTSFINSLATHGDGIMPKGIQ